MKIKFLEIYTPIEELCRFETVYRLSGGFNLDIEGRPTGFILPPLAPLEVDMDSRKAKPLVRVRVVEVAGDKIRVAKGSLLPNVGAFLSSGTSTATVKGVDTSNSGYDEITATASVTGIQTGAILFEATDGSANKPIGVANFLGYAPTHFEAGATITAIGRAFEVVTEKLHIPLTEADKVKLGHRFLFV